MERRKRRAFGDFRFPREIRDYRQKIIKITFEGFFNFLICD